MTNTSSHIAQDIPVKTALPTRRRRHRPSLLSQRCGPVRPGRFFRQRKSIVWIRLEMKPADLGDADWLLYRRRFNPYHPSTFKYAAYERGFVASKILTPKPNWNPIP